MKLSAILEDEEKMMMVPLYWLTREDRQKYLRDGYQVIPITGYQETDTLRAFKVIGQFSKNIWWFRSLSIPIWEDWKLTVKYANDIEMNNSTTGIQMFDHMDDDEKIKTLTYYWYDRTLDYIEKYFREHPDLLDRARHSLKPENVIKRFNDLFRK